MRWSLSPPVIRFPRRQPRLLLLLVIPFALLLYLNFHTVNEFKKSSPTPDLFPSLPPAHWEKEPLENATYTDDVLLVSAYFPLGEKSKHSLDDYRWWLSKYLGRIRTEIYFFAPPDIESYIREIRGDLPITIDTSFTCPFDIAPLAGREKYYEDMHKKDRERSYHYPELYAVWNAKPFFLAQALRAVLNRTGKTHKYAFWCDAGSFRDEHAYADWPGVARLDEIWREGQKESRMALEDMFFIPTFMAPSYRSRFWKEDKGPIDTDFSEGSFYGGRPKSVFWFEKYYYAYHDYYLDHSHMFVGKDQTLINALILLQPKKFITVWHSDPQAVGASYGSLGLLIWGSRYMLGDCGSLWYYYQFHIASKAEREAIRQIWDGKPRDVQTWDWLWKRRTCAETETLAMESLLRRTFGPRWRSPEAEVRS